jgi:hypothetical protein
MNAAPKIKMTYLSGKNIQLILSFSEFLLITTCNFSALMKNKGEDYAIQHDPARYKEGI